MHRCLSAFLGSFHSWVRVVSRSDRIVLGERKKGDERYQDSCILANVSTAVHKFLLLTNRS